MENQKFEAFALVELFGHQRMAGKVTEQTIGGGSFVRVDVPETDRQPAFTRLLNPSAIYAINPITEKVMMAMARNLQKSPIQEWDIKEVVEKHRKLLLDSQSSENGQEDWNG
jgi:hypothetical protein